MPHRCRSRHDCVATGSRRRRRLDDAYREREVFDRIVAGKLKEQIADELDIAERTLKREREQAMLKLDANSAAELGRLAELLQRPVRG